MRRPRDGRRRAGWLLAGAAVALTLGGCAASRDARSAAPYTQAANMKADIAQSLGGAREADTSSAPEAVKAPLAVPRRIIYNATVDLIAEDLGRVEAEIGRLVKAHGAYVSESERGGTPGTMRHARWQVRVPADRFDRFLAAVTALGELQRQHLDSQDVSEEYYDLEARLGSKRVEEQRLLRHLRETTGRLSEILAVERELSRVRGEIEQMQGRQRVLQNLTELATVTITAREPGHYVAPGTPPLGGQVARTFQRSVGLLGDFGRQLLLALVAFSPWLLIGGLVGWPLWLALRRNRGGRGGPQIP